MFTVFIILLCISIFILSLGYGENDSMFAIGLIGAIICIIALFVITKMEEVKEQQTKPTKTDTIYDTTYKADCIKGKDTFKNAAIEVKVYIITNDSTLTNSLKLK